MTRIFNSKFVNTENSIIHICIYFKLGLLLDYFSLFLVYILYVSNLCLRETYSRADACINLFQSAFSYFYRYSNRFFRTMKNLPIAIVGTRYHKQHVPTCCNENDTFGRGSASKNRVITYGVIRTTFSFYGTYQRRS